MKNTHARSDFSKLSAYERKLWVEVDRILYQNYLSPRTVTDFWVGNRDMVVFQLKQMKDRVIRAIVISEYLEADFLLDKAILNNLFGIAPTREKRKAQRVAQEMLDRLYPQQKMDIIRNVRNVPDDIVSHVMALNTVRNSFAHRYLLTNVPKTKRFYKAKYDLFTKKGLAKFRHDMYVVHEFLDPKGIKAATKLVERQKK